MNTGANDEKLWSSLKHRHLQRRVCSSAGDGASKTTNAGSYHNNMKRIGRLVLDHSVSIIYPVLTLSSILQGCLRSESPCDAAFSEYYDTFKRLQH